MFQKIFLVCSFVFPCAAYACTCAEKSIDTGAIVKAKSVFVFRLVQAQIKAGHSNAYNTTIFGKIKIVDQIRGVRRFKEVEFSTAACCGSRLDVGGYFVAAVSEMGPRFFANSGNVMEVGKEYPLSETRGKIQAVIKGKENFEAVFSRGFRDRTEQFPVLPPCPKQ